MSSDIRNPTLDLRMMLARLRKQIHVRHRNQNWKYQAIDRCRVSDLRISAWAILSVKEWRLIKNLTICEQEIQNGEFYRILQRV